MAGIWITGDTHGTIDIKKLSKRNLSRFDFNGTQDDNFLIICGDFGLIWNANGESKEETYWLDWLESKPFTTLFVSGNHENFDRLYSDEYEIINWHGGKAQQIRPHVIHLLRGEIYDILGKSIFTFGGASSHDIKDGVLDAVKDKQKIKEWSNPNKELNELTDIISAQFFISSILNIIQSNLELIINPGGLKKLHQEKSKNMHQRI